VSAYDGTAFASYTSADGLPSELVTCVSQRADGCLIFGTWDSGFTFYDGRVFQNLSAWDGLVHHGVRDLHTDGRGDLWIASENGVSQYRTPQERPTVAISDVESDRAYGAVARLRLPTSQLLLAFEFAGTSATTHESRIAYEYQLRSYDSQPLLTRATRVEYRDLPAGDYAFEVRAVDRDLNYSDSAQVQIEVHIPQSTMALWVAVAVAVVGLVAVSGYALRERRERNRVREALMREMEEELETAHKMQMGLMPERAPEVDGIALAGRCQPATHVGGDFYQYFPRNGKLLAGLADVTGHAMEAAVPVMMFSGVLNTEIKYGPALDTLFANLNNTMHQSLDNRTFVCFTMGELDPVTRTMRLANAGCPYPYLFRAATGEVEEVELDAFPLGVRANVDYPVVEIRLEPGDRVIFCSDGIIEAEDAARDLFGFERVSAVIEEGGRRDLSAADLLKVGLRLLLEGVDSDMIELLLRARMKTLLRDYQMRRAMIIEGIPAIQIGESPEKVRAKLRGVYQLSARQYEFRLDLSSHQ